MDRFIENCHICGQGEVRVDDKTGIAACDGCGRDFTDVLVKAGKLTPDPTESVRCLG